MRPVLRSMTITGSILRAVIDPAVRPGQSILESKDGRHDAPTVVIA